MPNSKCPFAWVKNNGGSDIWNFNILDGNMTCRVCNFSCRFRFCYRVKRHNESSLHIRRLEIFKNHRVRGVIEEDRRGSSFHLDIAKLLVSCDFPFNLLENPSFNRFIEKYTGKALPSRRSIENLVEVLKESTLQHIKEESENKDIFMTITEGRDERGKLLAAVLIGPLDEKIRGRPFLINLSDIENPEDAISVQKLVSSSLSETLGDDFKPEHLKALITNENEHFIRAGQGLQLKYPSLIHVSCLSRGLQSLLDDNHLLIKTDVQRIKDAIKLLEGEKRLAVMDVLLQEDISGSLKNSMEDLFKRNPGLNKLKDLSERDVYLKNTPIVNVDGEKVFRVMESIDMKRRYKLTTAKLRDILIIKWNVCSPKT